MNAPKLNSIVSNQDQIVKGHTASNGTRPVDADDLLDSVEEGGNGQIQAGVAEVLETEDYGQDGDVSDAWLDEDHHELIDAVEDRNVEERCELAQHFRAQLAGEVRERRADQSALGDRGLIEGIRRSGWWPWEQVFRFTSHFVVLGDAGLWYLCGVRALANSAGIGLAAIAVGVALMGKWAGRYLATVHLTDPVSGRQTVRWHVRALGKASVAAVSLAVLAVMLSFAPAVLAPVLLAIGWLPLVALNLVLAFIAGASASLADLLSRPRRHDDLEYEIQQRIRARKVLKRYVVLVALLLSLVRSPASAGDACGVFRDASASVDSADGSVGVGFVLNSITDQIAVTKCGWVVAGTFAGEGRFARRTWLQAIQPPVPVDCRNVEPEPLTGHAFFLGKLHSVAQHRKAEAVEVCEREEAIRQRHFEDEKAGFLRKLREALSVGPRIDRSRIRDFVSDVANSGLYRAVVVITDGIDTPAASLSNLSIPSGVAVTLIVVRPNPQYATPDQVLSRARQWAAVPGVRIITTGELRPGLWADLGAR